MKKSITNTAIAAVLFVGLVVPAAASDNGYFIKALKAENLGWRISAAQILGGEKEMDAVKPLIKMLKEDENYAARVSAAVALAQIGDKSALRALKVAAHNDRDQTVRTVAKAAYHQLKNLRDEFTAVE